jgi:hypothetical protein
MCVSARSIFLSCQNYCKGGKSVKVSLYKIIFVDASALESDTCASRMLVVDHVGQSLVAKRQATSRRVRDPAVYFYQCLTNLGRIYI